MGTLTIPYDFNPHAANAKIDSAQVDANFDAIKTLVNGNLDADNLADGAVTTAKVADGAVTEAKLAMGTKGARVYHTVSQSPSNSTPVAFNSERWDTDACHDNTTNNSRLTCNTAGKYLITAGLYTNATSYFFIKLNGTTVIASHYQSAAPSTFTMTTVYDLAVGDYLEIFPGTTLAMNVSANAFPEFSMVRLGA